MIPLRDENPTRSTPWVTYALVAANVVLFLYSQTPEGVRLTASAVMVPREILAGVGGVREFQTDGGAMTARSLSPIWLTIFTSMFLHAGWMHIIGNMLYLWIFGNNIEDCIGHVKFLVFYLACGVAAAFAHILSSGGSTVPTLGASGAIAGVLGAYLILYSGTRVLTMLIIPPFMRLAYLPAWLVLGFWFVLQVLSNLSSSGGTGGGIAYGAHIGGFVAGVVLIFLFGGRRKSVQSRDHDDAFRDRGYR